MSEPSRIAALLPFAIPADATQRMVLIALRRMAAHGLRDAVAGSLFLNGFGMHFRRPLVLLRAFVLELGEASARKICIAPCCSLRMIRDEACLIGVLAVAASNPDCAARHLRDLTRTRGIGEALSTSAAFNSALADLGRPLALNG